MKPLVLLLCCISFSLFAQIDSAQTTFMLKSPNANSVSVVGSFTQWSKQVPMVRDSSGLWSIRLSLPAQYHYYKFVVDGNWIPDPANPLRVNDGGESFNSIVKVGNPVLPKRKQSVLPFLKERLPQPLLPSHPEYVSLFYAAWEMAWQKISAGTPHNGFVERYMDEGFNEMIYQWDTCFMAAFGIYAPDLFPAMASLDNFYRKQRSDGYVQRVYSEDTGLPAAVPTPEEPMINPPLFAWIEWRYALLTGDTSRLSRVLPHLAAHYRWMETNTVADGTFHLFYNTPLGSGMDNTPRPAMDGGGWIDATAQMALAARCIARIAEMTGDNDVASAFTSRADAIDSAIVTTNWNRSSSYFFDVSRTGTQSKVKHIGAYWTLSAGIDIPGLNEFVDHLRNPREFARPHRFPTLSADDPAYNRNGHYWRGSVWAPTNFMVIKGLEERGFASLADSAAENHLAAMASVYQSGLDNDDSVAYEERFNDGYHTIWECYAPDEFQPATRWDDRFYSRQDFVGWSGLGPIAMLIENILGIQMRGLANTVYWRIHRNEPHGIRSVALKGQRISLFATPVRGGMEVVIEAEKPFTLLAAWKGRESTIKAGEGKTIRVLK